MGSQKCFGRNVSRFWFAWWVIFCSVRTICTNPFESVVILDIHPLFTTLIILFGWGTKTFVSGLISGWIGDVAPEAWLASSVPWIKYMVFFSYKCTSLDCCTEHRIYDWFFLSRIQRVSQRTFLHQKLSRVGHAVFPVIPRNGYLKTVPTTSDLIDTMSFFVQSIFISLLAWTAVTLAVPQASVVNRTNTAAHAAGKLYFGSATDNP